MDVWIQILFFNNFNTMLQFENHGLIWKEIKCEGSTVAPFWIYNLRNHLSLDYRNPFSIFIIFSSHRLRRSSKYQIFENHRGSRIIIQKKYNKIEIAMFITSISSTTTFLLHIAIILIFTNLAIFPAAAWEVRMLGYKGAVFEDSGLAHYTDCIPLHEPIFAEKVKFEARLKGNAALELYADYNCHEKINEQCSDPWMEDYHPRVCVGSYKVG